MLPEIKTYLARLADRRAEILKTLDGLDAEGLNWKPLPRDTNSLAVLATHSLGAERKWLHDVVGRRPVERDREAEFRARVEDVQPLRDQYAVVAKESEQILGALTEQDLEQMRSNGRYNGSVRWCILHVIEHYSEHLAQMGLTRQLFESEKAKGKTP